MKRTPRRRWAAPGLLLAALALLLTLGAGTAFAHHKPYGPHGVLGAEAAQFVVDDDKAQCPDAAYATIQDAVTAASPGDVIRVCPGTYSSTTVDKASLTLVGSTADLSRSSCLAGTGGTSPATESVVNGSAGAPGFSVTASGVTIKGFTVQGASGSNGAGVWVPSSVSGTRILRNLLQQNTMGVYLSSNGADWTAVNGNCIRSNNVAGSAAGNGVYSDAGLERARISGNVFTGHANAAVILIGPAGSQSQISVDRNDAVKDAPFIFANLTDSAVTRNLSDGSAGSGIFFGGGSSDVLVAKNVVRSCAFTGINVRYLPVSAGGYPVTTGNTRLALVGNRVTGCGDAGIRLRDDATGNLVRKNRVEGNGTGAVKGDGIALESATGNTLKDNRSTGNGRDGLRADATSTGNQVVKNRMAGNGEHDCHDDSTGSGTAGTANTWSSDVGATESKPGLCTAGPVKGEKSHKGGKRHDEHADKVAICHENVDGRYVEITVAAQGAASHDRKHDGDIVPAPAGGCPAHAGSTHGDGGTGHDA